MLTYKTMKSLAVRNKNKSELKEPEKHILTLEEKEKEEDKLLHINILKRWLIFVAFLLLEPFFFALAELVPFGLNFVLITKFLIIYPHVLIHLYLYELLRKMELDNYAESKLLLKMSTVIKEIILFTLDLISDAVKYVNLSELQEVEDRIDKINRKIGFKQEVCEKKSQLLAAGDKSGSDFKSSILFGRRTLF